MNEITLFFIYPQGSIIYLSSTSHIQIDLGKRFNQIQLSKKNLNKSFEKKTLAELNTITRMNEYVSYFVHVCGSHRDIKKKQAHCTRTVFI